MFNLSSRIKSSHNSTQTKGTLRGIAFTGILVTSLMGGSAFAESGSVHHSGQASKHSVLAAGHTLASTAKVASAVVAAPILMSGATSLAFGSAAVASGTAIMDSGNTLFSRVSAHDHNAPLIVTDIVITADPAPNRMIEKPKVVEQTLNKKVTQITTTSTSETSILKKGFQ